VGIKTFLFCFVILLDYSIISLCNYVKNLQCCMYVCMYVCIYIYVLDNFIESDSVSFKYIVNQPALVT